MAILTVDGWILRPAFAFNTLFFFKLYLFYFAFCLFFRSRSWQSLSTLFRQTNCRPSFDFNVLLTHYLNILLILVHFLLLFVFRSQSWQLLSTRFRQKWKCYLKNKLILSITEGDIHTPEKCVFKGKRDHLPKSWTQTKWLKKCQCEKWKILQGKSNNENTTSKAKGASVICFYRKSFIFIPTVQQPVPGKWKPYQAWLIWKEKLWSYLGGKNIKQSNWPT